MYKAYDQVDQCFLCKVLLQMGFDSQWVQLVIQCVSTVSFFVLLNGSRTTSFQASRGIRQGDPLSPYLFLFTIQVLSYLLSSTHEQGLITGINVARSSPILLDVLFTDDTLRFACATRQKSNTLSGILQSYTQASGQAINFQKSHVFFSKHTPPSLKHDIFENFHMQEMSLIICTIMQL